MIKTVKRFKKDDKTISLIDMVDILINHPGETVFFLHKTGELYQIHYNAFSRQYYVLPVVGSDTGIWGAQLCEGDHFDIWAEARMGDGTFYVINSQAAICGFLSMVLNGGLE